MKNQTLSAMAALRSRTAVSFPASASSMLPADLQAQWPADRREPSTTGHVSAGVGANVGLPGLPAVVGTSPITMTDPAFRLAAVATAKQDRPPRGVPR